MKALTIHPLYAGGIAFGLKTIEVRSWRTDYRGDILITSSSKLLHDTIPGHALCIARLDDVRPIKKKDAEFAMMRPADIDASCFAWCLSDIRLIKPVPVKGRLSLWNCDIEPEIIMPLNQYLQLSDEDDERIFNQYWRDLYV